MAKRKSVEWLDRALMRAPFFCLALSQKQFERALKHLRVKKKDWPAEPFVRDGAGATCWEFEKDGDLCCVVSYRPMKWHSLGMVTGLMAHEATHVWQALRKSIGEREPATEQEAYAIQNITEQLMTSYLKQKKGKKA